MDLFFKLGGMQWKECYIVVAKFIQFSVHVLEVILIQNLGLLGIPPAYRSPHFLINLKVRLAKTFTKYSMSKTSRN